MKSNNKTFEQHLRRKPEMHFGSDLKSSHRTFLYLVNKLLDLKLK